MGFFYIIHIVLCVLLICTVLFQEGKAGGLTSVADSSKAVFGAKGATSFLTKLTSILAFGFMVSSVFLAFRNSPGDASIASDFVPETQQSIPNVDAAGNSGSLDAQGAVEVIDEKTGEKTTLNLNEAVQEMEKVKWDDVPEELKQQHIRELQEKQRLEAEKNKQNAKEKNN